MFTRIVAVGLVGLVGLGLASSADECASQESCHVEEEEEFAMLQLKLKEVAAVGDEEGSSGQQMYTFLGKYPGYTGALELNGSVVVRCHSFDVEVRQILLWSLYGVDPLCRAVGDKPNSCGVHIHAGTDCSVAANVGGHYWNVTYTTVDPWMNVTYAASRTRSLVTTGFTLKDLVQRVLIVHDYYGARVACGVLVPQKLRVPSFVKYFNYAGKLAVGGSIRMAGIKTTQALSWSLSGLDVRCHSGPSTVPNSCGVHIHAGTSCESDAGPHYWNKALITTDPWMTVNYKGCQGRESHKQKVMVDTGFTNGGVIGHVVIVHNFDGARVACGVIGLA